MVDEILRMKSRKDNVSVTIVEKRRQDCTLQLLKVGEIDRSIECAAIEVAKGPGPVLGAKTAAILPIELA